MRGVVGVLLCVGLTSCLGYRIDPCGDNRTVQIDETGDAVFTCTGITADEVRWRVNDTDNTELLFGTCSTSGCVITADDCSISRPQSNTSVLNVTGDYRRVAGTVECAGMNGGQIQGSATCDVKVVCRSTQWTTPAAAAAVTTTTTHPVRSRSTQWTTPAAAAAVTTTTTHPVRDEKSDDDDNDSSVAFIIGGAVGATVVIIIALVIAVIIIRRRRGKPQNVEDKRNATDDDDEFVEHTNSMYQSADDPDLDQARPSAVALRIQSAGNGNADPQDPQTRDWEPEADPNHSAIPSRHSGPSAPSGRPAHGQADSDLYSSADQHVTHPDPDMAMGPYASVGELDDSAHQSADVDLYSSADGGVDNPSFVIEENSAHQPQDDNAYAVVNKSKKMPDPQNTEYAVVKKPRANLQQPGQPAGSASGEDDPADNVYAQVNKKSKGSHPVSPRPPEGEVENDAQAQTPQTTGKPLPAAKPEPLVAAKPPVPVKPQQAGTATNHDNENPR